MSDSTILVVEDESAIRDMIGMSLERAGFRWLAAGSVEEARSCLADNTPALIACNHAHRAGCGGRYDSWTGRRGG